LSCKVYFCVRSTLSAHLLAARALLLLPGWQGADEYGRTCFKRALYTHGTGDSICAHEPHAVSGGSGTQCSWGRAQSGWSNSRGHTTCGTPSARAAATVPAPPWLTCRAQGQLDALRRLPTSPYNRPSALWTGGSGTGHAPSALQHSQTSTHCLGIGSLPSNHNPGQRALRARPCCCDARGAGAHQRRTARQEPAVRHRGAHGRQDRRAAARVLARRRRGARSFPQRLAAACRPRGRLRRALRRMCRARQPQSARAWCSSPVR